MPSQTVENPIWNENRSNYGWIQQLQIHVAPSSNLSHPPPFTLSHCPKLTRKEPSVIACWDSTYFRDCQAHVFISVLASLSFFWLVQCGGWHHMETIRICKKKKNKVDDPFIFSFLFLFFSVFVTLSTGVRRLPQYSTALTISMWHHMEPIRNCEKQSGWIFFPSFLPRRPFLSTKRKAQYTAHQSLLKWKQDGQSAAQEKHIREQRVRTLLGRNGSMLARVAGCIFAYGERNAGE